MKKWIWISIIVVIAAVSSAIYIYVSAMDPLRKAETLAKEIAREEANLVQMEDFTLYNGTESFFIVRGIDDKGNELIVWIPEEEKNRKITIKEAKDGISKEEAVQKVFKEKNPQEIITVRLGMENKIPLWEIYYRSNEDLINYYYVDFESGEWLKDIQNL